MKLNKNGRKTQKAIRRALMLGLPVTGLLLTVGCDRSAPEAKDPKEVLTGCIIDKGDSNEDCSDWKSDKFNPK